MKIEQNVAQRIWRDAFLSILLYLAPIALMFATFYFTDHKPWAISNGLPFKAPGFIEAIFNNLSSWGLPVIILAIGVIEFIAGLYETKWTKNERILDIACFVIPKIIIPPVVAYYSLQFLPQWLPGLKDSFAWIPFWWAFAIIAVADDLTQYWYHRLHHQVPWLWRFHRTHHSAPYMGMAMAGRQNFIYTVFFSQTYLTVALTYMGLGYAALFVKVVKSLIVTGAHSSIPWDKPFYQIRVLNPIAWVLERFISTPATHYAHHADTTDDGVGHYKGNFGNMFFLWDIIFGTGIITRRYPTSFGIKHYKEEEWYAQLLWPIFKSKKEGSELAADGPMVGDEVPVHPLTTEPLLEAKAAS
ncbi:sterol desaturase family protein [Dyadobacter sp. CY326]|uniref:sterol desaturase family protein n=1 Tax=Dyadobacter sp. CY326 TaxID=2907300 RepID=UPI001F37D909|nr:sterol desaturase family protein [Dyadobacter sp. CY326]MCE7064083.1 sterol desaturase family protein [Dyadobacter sp. CY326]